MTNERAKQILCMSEQEAWRSGITLEEHREAISVAVKAIDILEDIKNVRLPLILESAQEVKNIVSDIKEDL